MSKTNAVDAEDGKAASQMCADDKKSGSSGCMKVAIGCVIGAAVCFIVVIVVIALIVLNVNKIGSFIAAQVADQVIDASTLTSAEKDDAKETVREFLRQTVDGKIPMSDAEAILQRLMQGTMGRFIILGSVQGALGKSGLSNAEKQAGAQTVKTFMNGLARNMFTEDEIESVLDAIPRQTAASPPSREAEQPQPELPAPPKPPPWTDKEVRLVLARMRDLLEGRDIPGGPTPPIPAEELREIIRAMKKAMGKPVPPADEPQPETPQEEPAPEPVV